MLTPDEKGFFITTAIGASRLSGCTPRRGSALVQDRQLLSYGFNRKIIKNEKWEISAIYDAIFGARSESLVNATIFCTYFPSVEDIMLIVATGISSINYMGEVNNPESVRFINKLKSESIPLEIIELEKS